jgi:hypothetical protein
MRLSVGRVLGQLDQEGLAPADAEQKARAALAPELADALPWYMRAAVALGAWFATTFLLFAIFAIAGIRDEIPATVVGGVLVAAGIVLRQIAETEFLKWAAVALSLAGLGMVTFGIGGITDSAMSAAVACLVVSIMLIVLANDATLRFLCTLSGGTALFVWLVGGKFPWAFDAAIGISILALGYVWRWRVIDRGDDLTRMLEPVGYGLAVVLFAALLGRTLAASSMSHWSRDLGDEIGALGPLATILCTAALLALSWKIIDEHGTSASSPAAFATLGGVVTLGAVTLDTPGIVAGAAMLMLAFDRRNRVLLGMAVVFLLVFASFYYYSLHLTLLQKSGALAGSGLLLLSIRSKIARA